MKNEESCAEMMARLETEWDKWWDGERSYRMTLLVDKGCKEVIPYLLRHLKAEDPFHRERALHGLSELKCREYRQMFIDALLNDPENEVKQAALLELGAIFRGEGDKEILQLALNVFDNPESTVGLRLTAGAVMMYQLSIPGDERGGPPWWDEEPEDLQHPSVVRAVQEARRLVAQ